MRSLVCIGVALMLTVALSAGRAEAAAQFSIWPSTYSYGTPPPAGTFTWNATMFGVRLGQPLGPFVSLQSTLKYGSITNLSLGPTSLGSTGSTLVADSALQFGLGAGPISLAAYLGYGALVLNASGPGPADRVILLNQGTRVGVEATLATSRGLVVRGSYTLLPSLTSSSNISLPAQGITTQQNGNGSGSEYEITVLYSPVPVTTLFAGYRGGTHQTTWSGGQNTTATFNGWMVGVELGF
jgi:hypothetical protein